jgi:DNA-directed RNA polymerase specialized sigma24 family protein
VNADEVVHIDDFDDQLSKRQILSMILGRVTKKVRDAVHYTYIEELSQREITKLTGQSPATIRRNLQKFREFLPAARREFGLE